MGRNWVEPVTFSALLVASDSERSDPSARLVELADGLRERGHWVRFVTSSAANETLQARDSPYWPGAHAEEYPSPPGRLATFAGAIFRALNAGPTHIIHTASLRVTYAAALASFAFTLRHPCAPEPAIVTTLDGDGGLSHVRRLLPGDYFIFSSERSRDAFVGSGRRHHLGERAYVIMPGRDPVAAILTVYQLAWERRQRENRQALLAYEA